MLGEQLGALAEDEPREEAADNGVADAYPCAGEAELPPKLSGIANEDYGAEIAGAEGEGCEPRAYAASAEHEAINAAGLLTGIESYAYHDGEEQDYEYYFDCHVSN